MLRKLRKTVGVYFFATPCIMDGKLGRQNRFEADVVSKWEFGW